MSSPSPPFTPERPREHVVPVGPRLGLNPTRRSPPPRRASSTQFGSSPMPATHNALEAKVLTLKDQRKKDHQRIAKLRMKAADRRAKHEDLVAQVADLSARLAASEQAKADAEGKLESAKGQLEEAEKQYKALKAKKDKRDAGKTSPAAARPATRARAKPAPLKLNAAAVTFLAAARPNRKAAVPAPLYALDDKGRTPGALLAKADEPAPAYEAGSDEETPARKRPRVTSVTTRARAAVVAA